MDTINTDISTYTIDELFSLLDISVDEKSTTENIKKLIEDRTNTYIKSFTDMGRINVATFFQKVQKQLIGSHDNLTAAEKQLLSYDNGYVPFSGVSSKANKDDMFNSNNGSGNPIHRKTISKLLNIDSRFRPNYENTTSTDFILDLPYPINNVIEMTLCDLELPTTYYPFSSANQNNYFWFATYTAQQVITNKPNIYYYVIPDGNYYFDNLVTDLNKGIKSINTSDTGFGVGDASPTIPISVVFDLNFNNLGGVGNGTGRLSFGIMPTSPTDISLNSVVGKEIVQVDLNFNAPALSGVTTSMRVLKAVDIAKYYLTSNIPLNQRVGWMLGFRHSYYTSSNKTNSPQLYYISESILNIIGPSYLYIILDDFNKSNNINFLTTSKYGMLRDNILARVSLKSSAFSIQSQNDFSVYAEPRYYYGPVNISKIRITIVDEFSRILDLNKNDFSCTLRMTTIYSAT